MVLISVDVEDLSSAITEALDDYSAEVADEIKQAVNRVAKEAMNEIKSHVTFKGTGKYVKAFRLKTTYESKHSKEKTWYVKKPYYRLTHLLENGHACRNGGRTRAFPHIKYGEELAKRRMVELSKGAIEGDG